MEQPLHVFVTVVEKHHFSRAAEVLHMTQPGVSQHIKLLEQSVGAKLLDRNNKRVFLTKAGEIVYHHAKEMLGLQTRMQRLVDDLMHTASGKLSIGASYSFGEYVLPHVISDFCQSYPDVTPSIVIGNTKKIAEEVLNRELDIGIVEGEVTDDHLRIEPFAEDAMDIIVSRHHSFAERTNITVNELERETWIIREEGSGTREMADQLFIELGIEPNNVRVFGSTQLIKEAVEAGLGVSLLSNWTTRKELKLDTIRTVALDGLPITRSFSMVTLKTTFQTKVMELFLHFLREQAPHFHRDNLQLPR